jgi:hypothetical protein
VDTQQQAARQYILSVCLWLEAGVEVAFDHRLVQVAFPGSFGASSEDQLLAELRASAGTFWCRRNLASGDYIVSRRVGDEEPPQDDAA